MSNFSGQMAFCSSTGGLMSTGGPTATLGIDVSWLPTKGSRTAF